MLTNSREAARRFPQSLQSRGIASRSKHFGSCTTCPHAHVQCHVTRTPPPSSNELTHLGEQTFARWPSRCRRLRLSPKPACLPDSWRCLCSRSRFFDAWWKARPCRRQPATQRKPRSTSIRTPGLGTSCCGFCRPRDSHVTCSPLRDPLRSVPTPSHRTKEAQEHAADSQYCTLTIMSEAKNTYKVVYFPIFGRAGAVAVQC